MPTSCSHDDGLPKKLEMRFPRMEKSFNKSNGVRTIDAISLELVPLYRTSTCSFELLLESSSDSHTFLFQTLIYRNFGQNGDFSRFQLVCDGPTDRPTDGPTDGKVAYRVV